MGEMVELLISTSCYRGFVSQMLQDYQRQLRDLEKLLGSKPSKLWRMYLTVKSPQIDIDRSDVKSSGWF